MFFFVFVESESENRLFYQCKSSIFFKMNSFYSSFYDTDMYKIHLYEVMLFIFFGQHKKYVLIIK